MMPPRYPVLWFTVALFVLVAVAANQYIAGTLILSAVLCGQGCIRWLFRWFRAPVWLRRSVMLLPALGLAYCVFDQRIAPIRIALAGHTPAGLREVHVDEDVWTDYVVRAYFRCDSASLRSILESPPFERNPSWLKQTFSFAGTPFLDLQTRADLLDPIIFRRIDLGDRGDCLVYTDATFSFAYITYGVD